MRETMTEAYLLDVNVLIALAWPQHIHHERAHAWFDSIDGAWATTPITESAFLRLSTNARIVGTTISMAYALEMLVAIRAVPGHRFIDDSTTFTRPNVSLERLTTSGQVTDLHLVQIAAAGGVVLATLDRAIEHLVVDTDRGLILVLP